MKQIKCNDFEKEVAKTNEMVVLLFTNNWNGSAIILEGALTALQKKWSKTFRFVKISNDDCRKIGKKYTIQNVPSILIFDSGKVIEKISGVPSKNYIDNVLEKLNQTP